MKKIVKSMATLLVIAGVAGFMGCKQPTDEFEPVAKPLQKGVKILPAGTNGNFGPSTKEGEYVEFGYWPQSKKADSVKLGTKITNVNGWSCLTGTDGAYYVKVTATPFEATYTFDDGSKVESKEYYFKLEPIQWRVLTDEYNGKKLLFAEKALAASCFYKDSKNRGPDTEPIYPNNYKESDIRNYLNSDFINNAFTPAEIEKIPETVVDNSAETTTDAGNSITKATDCFCDNTKDKIFLLSEKEITTAEYGFDACDKYVGDGKETKTSTRIRKTTDYARATGAISVTNFNLKLENSSVFWLRSPCFGSYNCVRRVYGDGDSYGYEYVIYPHMSVVPALSMTF